MLREISAQAAIDTLPDKENYAVKAVANLDDATKVMTTQKIFGQNVAAIILDNDFPATAERVGKPDDANLGRGISFTRRTRMAGNNVPILWNSARFDAENIAALSEAVHATPPAIASDTTHVILDKNTEAVTKDHNSGRTIIDFLSRHLGKERSTQHSLGA